MLKSLRWMVRRPLLTKIRFFWHVSKSASEKEQQKQRRSASCPLLRQAALAEQDGLLLPLAVRNSLLLHLVVLNSLLFHPT